MAKSKQQKKIAWFKMPVNLMDDERIAELVAQKGVAGMGTYIAIIGEMYRRQCRCLTVTQLKALKFAGATQKTIMAVVEEFGLFRIDKMGHIYSVIDFLGFDDENKDKENESDSDENAIGFKSGSSPTPAHVYKDKDKDEYKDHHNDGAAYIMQIPEHSQWTEVALMKSGFGELIKRNWQFVLEQFRNHAIVNCRTGQIRNVDDAKKYFNYYVSNSTSGSMLRKALEDYECQHPQQNPYRFEDAGSCPGHRIYKGYVLPEDAPPRPSDRAEWNFENNSWIIF